MKTKYAVLAILAAVVLTASVSIVGTLTISTILGNRDDVYYITFDKDEVDKASVQKFEEVRDLLHEKYIEEFTDDVLLEGMTAGMAAALGDPYTMYVDKDTMDSMNIDSEGQYSGIGVTISTANTGVGIMVLDVNELGPAYEAGMLPGDRIIRVNDIDVMFEEDLSYVANVVRGEVGTDVEIEVIREDTPRNPVFTITRRVVNSIDVEGELLEGNTGYIKIKSFTQDSPDEFIEVYNNLANQGMDSLIIDLRDNPGGSLYAVVYIADLIMYDGIITYTIDKAGAREDYEAGGSGVNLPIAVLVNEYSASASEMLSGALRDNGLAKIIGTTTFGKGLVQGVYDLDDGSGLRVTIAKYYTPAGISIQDVGVVPDYELEPMEEYLNKPVSSIPFEDDIQLHKALEVLGAR
ncbi:MAG TPA: S41 family peptidase [Clostridia bacterium]|nr:S41 family peptidase [Clostridia bacterium]HRX41946.1 S41 family peptidase [Clostridia bacterium]